MAGLGSDLESVIIDLSATSLDELPAMDDAAIAAVVPCAVDASSRLRNNEGIQPPDSPNR